MLVSPDCSREGTSPSYDPSCTARENLVKSATSSTMISAQSVSIPRNARSRRHERPELRIDAGIWGRYLALRIRNSPLV